MFNCMNWPLKTESVTTQRFKIILKAKKDKVSRKESPRNHKTSSVENAGQNCELTWKEVICSLHTIVFHESLYDVSGLRLNFFVVEDVVELHMAGIIIYSCGLSLGQLAQNSRLNNLWCV